ncbi:sensory neuron membrane protein 2 [Arctopsyche grandis]|uniref:sensory neuron membrane protein 2 n=1 Tax=Arctopsyche grandis TaxID=121162 RepID=UPI00406D8E63
MGTVCFIVFFCIGLVVAVLGIVLGWAVYPVIVDDNIIKTVVLEEGSEAYERWEEVPFPLDFKVYIFNITNKDEVIAGKKPNLTEIGPYVYKQYRKKFDISLEDGIWTYHQQQKFVFDEKKSGELLETDEVDILNVPLNAILQVAESKGLLDTVNKDLDEIFLGETDIVIRTQVKNLLFEGIKFCEKGRPLVICLAIRNLPIKTLRKGDDNSLYISMFNHKNTKPDGKYEVFDGKDNIEDLGRIAKWEGSSTLKIWSGDDSTCNMINGTDSTIYAPRVYKNKDIFIYNSDICRSVRTRFEKKVFYQGIKGFRYVASEETLEAPSVENGTMCFCLNQTIGITQPNGCLKKGAMELYPCFDSHVVLSYPHFLDADEEYQSGVNGLSPDKDLHRIFLDIEPNTGTPLRGGKRVQFNMFIRKLENVVTTDHLTTLLMPFMWIDEGVELPDEFIDFLNTSLLDILLVLAIVKWVLVGVGGTVAIVFIMVLLFKKKSDDIKSV